jgi:hypothetical protein
VPVERSPHERSRATREFDRHDAWFRDGVRRCWRAESKRFDRTARAQARCLRVSEARDWESDVHGVRTQHESPRLSEARDRQLDVRSVRTQAKCLDSAKLAIGNPTSGVFVSKANLRDSAKLAIADQTTTTSTLKSILVGSATLALGKSTSELFPGSADGGRVLRESWGDRKSNPEVAKRESTKNSADQAAPIIVDCSPVCVVCGGSLVSLKTTISWLAPGLGIRRRHVFPACPGCVERGQDQKSSDLLRSLLAENGASRFLPVIVQGGGAGDGNPAGRLRLVRDGE